MKKFLLLIILAGIGLGTAVGYGVTHVNKQPETKQVLSAQSVAPTQARLLEVSPTTQPGLPVKVEIPRINVSTDIESVGMDSQGRMDIPKDADNTAWFRLGYRPGAIGNAVLDGHYDKVTGAPAVFWDLDKLQPSDKIIIIDDSGKKWVFAVNRSTKYPYDNLPMKEVFGPSSESHLNLITCHGTWNTNTKNYSERMVVYATLIR